MKQPSNRKEQPDKPIKLSRPVIAWLTDFGLRDGYVGVMKGVVLNLAPEAVLVDITHNIAPQNIAEGAWVLTTSYRYFPPGTIFTCVVDPGVGSNRRPIAVAAGKWIFVAPDNGLLSYVLTEQPVHEAVVLTNSRYHLNTVSATFQGRDLFSPVAAHIANGIPLQELGSALPASKLHHIDRVRPERQGGRITASVVHIDHFGNIVTNIAETLVPDVFSCTHLQLTFAERKSKITMRRRYFAEDTTSGTQNRYAPFIYIDSSGHIGVAIQNGNAARELAISIGQQVVLLLSKEP